MKKKKTGKSALESSFDFLAAKARTVRETEDYLDGQNYGEVEVYEAVERLKELNYLNDAKYAAEFVSTRLATKPLSRRKLKEQLGSHKLPENVISEALALVNDEVERQNAMAVTEKYYRQFASLEENVRKQRVMRRLMTRGYDFDVIRESVESMIGPVEYSDDGFDDDDE